MKDVRIKPRAQVVTLAAVAAATAVAVATNLPDLKRYMKIRSM
jgi:hypothetical protein